MHYPVQNARNEQCSLAKPLLSQLGTDPIVSTILPRCTRYHQACSFPNGSHNLAFSCQFSCNRFSRPFIVFPSPLVPPEPPSIHPEFPFTAQRCPSGRHNDMDTTPHCDIVIVLPRPSTNRIFLSSIGLALPTVTHKPSRNIPVKNTDTWPTLTASAQTYPGRQGWP